MSFQLENMQKNSKSGNIIIKIKYISKRNYKMLSFMAWAFESTSNLKTHFLETYKLLNTYIFNRKTIIKLK